ncbi:hypothetical protein A9Q84_08805 [Halobacteriovorax marinus]|uniref:16S rRNA (Guanine(966)-N(2))-methyltransferase RsmD n=1 Tax=Halobacteriovorax marinus TaxID=97084 RepID=A0A1Y5FCU0_9BACT|nr:hypothetical protein A9Q84_08805 [Halobacteriovorax marinus]
MSIKILGGLAKGQTLLVPKGDLIRPTSVMLRRKIFDARQDMSGYSFFDICAGSGAVGLEALSRGADEVTLVETNSKVFSLTKTNVKTIQNSSADLGNIQLQKGDAIKWLSKFQSTYMAMSEIEKESVIIFIDPPYEQHEIYKSALNILNEINFCGEIWIESDEQKGIKKSYLQELFPDKKIYSQGTSFILIVR